MLHLPSCSEDNPPYLQVEFKKYGASVAFLRRVMEKCGYELIPRDNPNPPPEMEALMEWYVTRPITLSCPTLHQAPVAKLVPPPA